MNAGTVKKLRGAHRILPWNLLHHEASYLNMRARCGVWYQP